MPRPLKRPPNVGATPMVTAVNHSRAGAIVSTTGKPASREPRCISLGKEQRMQMTFHDRAPLEKVPRLAAGRIPAVAKFPRSGSSQ